MAKPEITDKDTEFLKLIIDKLQKEFDSGLLNADFKTPKAKNRFVESIREIFEELNVEFTEDLFKKIDFEFNLGKEEMIDKMKPIPETFFREPSKDVLESLLTLGAIKEGAKAEIDELFGVAILKLRQTLNIFEAQAKREILAEITSGEILGKPFEKINQKIIEKFQKGGINNFKINSGNGERTYSLEASANRLTRQTIGNSRRQGQINTVIKKGYDLVKVAKHSDESPMCKPYSNKIYSLTGITEGYPVLEKIMWDRSYEKGSGIGHPFCRHTFDIYIPTKIKFNT